MTISQSCLLSATGISRYYNQQCAVDALSLQLSKGEVLGLLGPNGAGKSTTMQIITGNLAPTTGEIIINGVDLLEEPQRAKQQLGYLPEQPPIYRDMTVVEFLRYCAALHQLTKAQQRPAIERVLQRCGLEAVAQRLIGNLSKGYQQRVGIAQAIIHSPAVVVLDEPTVGLDPVQIVEIRHLIRDLGKEHGIILSTHILSEVEVVCDRVQILQQGKTVFNAPLAGITSLESVFFERVAAVKHEQEQQA